MLWTVSLLQLGLYIELHLHDDCRGGTEPCHPVNRGVPGQVLGASHEAHEDALSRQVDEQHATCDETWKSKAIADSLHGHTGGSKGRRSDI